MRISRALGTSLLALSAAATLGTGVAQAGTGPSGTEHTHSHGDGHRTVALSARLTELNGSGASGRARVLVRDGEIQRVQVRARGLTPGMPHAQHIHYGQQALNECPTLAQDVDHDGRLTTVEGVPAYGPVAISLTTTGDTSPTSVLAVPRYPVADARGRVDYRRSDIAVGDVAGAGARGTTASAAEVRQAIADGEGVVVIHGLDYDGNGTYNVSDPEGVSELDPSLPAEATDPAVCGLLH
jgi:hypothetical protein